MRIVPLTLVVSLLVSACGDPSGPSFPEVEGTYDFSAPIDQLSGAQWTGTLALFHEGDEEFGGSFSISISDSSGQVSETINGDVSEGEVTSDDLISWEMEGMRLDGEVSGRAMSGTWVIAGSTNYSGTFTASRR